MSHFVNFFDTFCKSNVYEGETRLKSSKYVTTKVIRTKASLSQVCEEPWSLFDEWAGNTSFERQKGECYNDIGYRIFRILFLLN